MRSLFRKELRSLAPFLALVLFFEALNWVFMFLTEFPDQYPLSKILHSEDGGQVLMFVVAFALASGLLVRERDEGTLAFLDALPVSRARIFFSKFVLALGILLLGFLADQVGPMRAIDIVETVCFVWVAWIGLRWRRRERVG